MTGKWEKEHFAHDPHPFAPASACERLQLHLSLHYLAAPAVEIEHRVAPRFRAIIFDRQAFQGVCLHRGESVGTAVFGIRIVKDDTLRSGAPGYNAHSTLAGGQSSRFFAQAMIRGSIGGS